MSIPGAVRFFSLFACFFFFLFSQSLSAARIPLTPARTEELARHPTWLKLLHVEQGRSSEVLTDDFFLSPAGRYDPKAELLATVRAYSAPWPDAGDSHARCRFPARYFWLSHHLALPEYSLHNPRCTRFSRWSLPDRVKSVSLFLVSGYLANPASVFGHALLKLSAFFWNLADTSKG